MRANLKQGRLVEPRSLGEGTRRHQQLVVELAKIQAQLDDPLRLIRAGCLAAYTEWLARARRARELLWEEERQLGTWIQARQTDAAYLLQQLRAIVERVCCVSLDLDPDERAIVRLVDQFLNRTTQPTKETDHMTTQEKQAKKETAIEDEQIEIMGAIGAAYQHAKEIASAPGYDCTYLAFLIFDELSSDDADEAVVLESVARAYGGAKEVFNTPSPTDEQVLGIYERVFARAE